MDDRELADAEFGMWFCIGLVLVLTIGASFAIDFVVAVFP